MGLAPYGQPIEIENMRSILHLKQNGSYELDLDYFTHHSDGVSMSWDNESPTITNVYSNKLVEMFGPSRKDGELITTHHKNIAASLQLMYEEAFFHILNHVYNHVRSKNLCLSGGCAMNSVANGKIFEKTNFKDIYIQSAAGDAGGAIGAAYYLWNQGLNKPRSFIMDHAFWGPEYQDNEINDLLKSHYDALAAEHCSIEKIIDIEHLCLRAARIVSEGNVLGWFQGRMEWGPRALGNRSIICDPRRSDMKDILNLKIKRRESFRPFAPVVLREETGNWFETDYDVPFMLQVYQIREEKRSIIPAVTHVNGSGRLQTITEKQNPRYYKLIKEFFKLTGVPVMLNTSFNENEPVVCTPLEALNCFLRTKMDALILGDWFIERRL